MCLGHLDYRWMSRSDGSRHTAQTLNTHIGFRGSIETVLMEVCVHSSQARKQRKTKRYMSCQEFMNVRSKKSWWATMRQSPRLGLSRELR